MAAVTALLTTIHLQVLVLVILLTALITLLRAFLLLLMATVILLIPISSADTARQITGVRHPLITPLTRLPGLCLAQVPDQLLRDNARPAIIGCLIPEAGAWLMGLLILRHHGHQV